MEKSIITKIKLHNFGPFYEVHELKFPRDARGIHIIRGNTGQGKTSFQRAILWCLYGKVFDRNGKEIPFTSILNRSAFKENNFAFAVSIYFNHEGKNWVLTRKTKAKVHQNRKYQSGMESYLVKNGEPLTTTSEKTRLEIERILPFNVSRFFFFDGEMLVKYEELLDQDSRAMRILRNSIEHILGIPYLRTARDDLYEIRSKMEREISKILKRIGGKDYTELAEMYEYISDEIDRKKKQIKSLQVQIDALEEDIATLKRKQTEIQSIRELAIKRQDIEKEIETLEAESNSEKIKLGHLNSRLHKSVLMPLAQCIIDELKLKHEKVMSKYNKKQRLLSIKKSLDQGINAQICRLCGNILNPTMLKQFEKELKEIEIKIESLTEIPEPNLVYDNSARYLEKMRSQLVDPDEYTRIEKRKLKIDHQIASKKAGLSQVKEKLIEVDDEEPFRLETQINISTEELGRLKGEKSSVEEQLEMDLQTQRNLNQDLARIDREELNTIKAIKEYVETISEVFEESISIYREKRRTEVESKATEIFRQIRSKEDFSKLEINPNFGLSIVTKDGTVLNKAEWRSAGEEQLVALALIGALNKCAQVEAPVFMDTPFARLDMKHGQRVLTYLPNMSDQIAIFVTDREFRKEDEKYLQGHIKSDHTILYKGEEYGSHILKTSHMGGQI